MELSLISMIQNCSELPKHVHMVIKINYVTKFLAINSDRYPLKSYSINYFIDSKSHY